MEILPLLECLTFVVNTLQLQAKLMVRSCGTVTLISIAELNRPCLQTELLLPCLQSRACVQLSQAALLGFWWAIGGQKNRAELLIFTARVNGSYLLSP